MAKVVTITGTVPNNNTTYYKISIKVPLRQIQVERRYSEFDDLLKDLADCLGISIGDFPYKLPPKSSIFTKNSSTTILERKKGLETFLNNLVSDREIQNLLPLHEFLQLPIKFQFTSNLLVNKNNEINDLIIHNEAAIDSMKWLEYLRLFKSHVNRLMESFNQDPSITSKLDIRTKLQKIVIPNMSLLSNRLEGLRSEGAIAEEEYQRRKVNFKELGHEISALNELLVSKNNNQDDQKSSLLRSSRRVLGGQPTETKETLPLSNQELLQLQIQIHRQQDQELEELRKIIARQKDIGLTINQEVEEQNEMLDQLNDQVEHTSDKLRAARRKAKQIL